MDCLIKRIYKEYIKTTDHPVIWRKEIVDIIKLSHKQNIDIHFNIYKKDYVNHAPILFARGTYMLEIWVGKKWLEKKLTKEEFATYIVYRLEGKIK